jgi:hypothetical protein
MFKRTDGEHVTVSILNEIKPTYCMKRVWRGWGGKMERK